MKPQPYPLLFVWLLAACGHGPVAPTAQATASSSTSVDEAGPIPQAVPMVAFLRSLQTGDEETFKRAWSVRMAEKHAADGWRTVLKRYQDFLDPSGKADLSLSGATYSYEGSETEGKLTVVHPNFGEALNMRVTLESAGWRIDEN